MKDFSQNTEYTLDQRCKSMAEHMLLLHKSPYVVANQSTTYHTHQKKKFTVVSVHNVIRKFLQQIFQN